MERMKYNTVAKESILGLFKANPDRQFTAEEIFSAVNPKKCQVLCGKSTVYRIVSKLCSEGVIRRYYGENENTARYQLSKSGDCEHHFHMKCLSCGKVYHLKCDKSDSLMEHVFAEHGFKINSGISMLYGECGSCKK